MLTITIPKRELWDESNEVFINLKEQTLTLEHSLVSLQKWESKWKQPFLRHNKFSKEKTKEQIVDYIRCMTITQNVNPEIYTCLPQSVIDAITSYIEEPMSAVVLPKRNGGGSREPITSDLIYYWMVSFNIPFECQKWHLNRLLTLINICDIKNSGSKNRMSRNELFKRNSDLNAIRRRRLGSKG